MGGRHVGVFEGDWRRASFRYDTDAPERPISLSLPRDGGWSENAPLVFLNNLLPESGEQRYLMMRRMGAKSQQPFDLLDRIDNIGDLVFSSKDEYPTAETMPAAQAEKDGSDIAARIVEIKANPAKWWTDDPHARFSLGGMQGKFTLSRVGGKWFWPNAATPSTHILKPEGVGTPGAEANESGMLRLAAACGVETTDSGIAVFDGHHSFMTARFDRETVDGKPVRIHAEDVCSALGVPAGSKYDVRAADVLSLLHRIDPDDGLAYAWIGQLAFSTYSGNADAHARNYTLLAATGDGYCLSPLYDAVCTACWPALSTRLAMPVGGEDRASRVGDAEWAALARSNRLDEGRVVDMARNMASEIARNAWIALRGQPSAAADRMGRMLESIPAVARRQVRTEPPAPPHAGMVWVEGHWRNGHWVDGYWRSRPTR